MLLLAFPFAGAAQRIDYGRSQITVVSRQMNIPVEAKFTKFTAQFAFDASRLEASMARIEVDLSSFDIGNDEVNNEAQGKNWFDIRAFPKATFISSSVRAVGSGRYEVVGPLTIKGKTHEVTAPFTVKTDASGNSVFTGGFNIRRLMYNIGDGVWKNTDTVADGVQIRFRIHTSGNLSGKT
jgi:polyisoprenoid-binding protein YceI